MNSVVLVVFLCVLVVCVSAQQNDDKLDFHLIPPGNNKNKLLSKRSPKSIPLNYEYQYRSPSASSDEYRKPSKPSKPHKPHKPHKPSKPSKPSGPSGSNGLGVDIGDVVDVVNVIQGVVGESKKAFQKR